MLNRCSYSSQDISIFRKFVSETLGEIVNETEVTIGDTTVSLWLVHVSVFAPQEEQFGLGKEGVVHIPAYARIIKQYADLLDPKLIQSLEKDSVDKIYGEHYVCITVGLGALPQWQTMQEQAMKDPLTLEATSNLQDSANLSGLVDTITLTAPAPEDLTKLEPNSHSEISEEKQTLQVQVECQSTESELEDIEGFRLEESLQKESLQPLQGWTTQDVLKQEESSALYTTNSVDPLNSVDSLEGESSLNLESVASLHEVLEWVEHDEQDLSVLPLAVKIVESALKPASSALEFNQRLESLTTHFKSTYNTLLQASRVYDNPSSAEVFLDYKSFMSLPYGVTPLDLQLDREHTVKLAQLMTFSTKENPLFSVEHKLLYVLKQISIHNHKIAKLKQSIMLGKNSFHEFPRSFNTTQFAFQLERLLMDTALLFEIAVKLFQKCQEQVQDQNQEHIGLIQSQQAQKGQAKSTDYMATKQKATESSDSSDSSLSHSHELSLAKAYKQALLFALDMLKTLETIKSQAQNLARYELFYGKEHASSTSATKGGARYHAQNAQSNYLDQQQSNKNSQASQNAQCSEASRICLSDQHPQNKNEIAQSVQDTSKVAQANEATNAHRTSDMEANYELLFVLPDNFDISSFTTSWQCSFIKQLITDSSRQPQHLAENEFFKLSQQVNGFTGAWITTWQEAKSAFINSNLRANKLKLPDYGTIRTHYVFPLLSEEIALLAKFGLIEMWPHLVGSSPMLVERKSYIFGQLNPQQLLAFILDDARIHLASLHRKHLPVAELSCYNHLAILLRWAIDKDVVSPLFKDKYPELVQKVLFAKDKPDLRVFIRDELKGLLLLGLFEKSIREVMLDYYTGNAPCYPSEIDNYALRYFGLDKYACPEFFNEAYLFVPFDEAYYREMSKIISLQVTIVHKLQATKERAEVGALLQSQLPEFVSKLQCYWNTKIALYSNPLASFLALTEYNYRFRQSRRNLNTPVILDISAEWPRFPVNAIDKIGFESQTVKVLALAQLTGLSGKIDSTELTALWRKYGLDKISEQLDKVSEQAVSGQYTSDQYEFTHDMSALSGQAKMKLSCRLEFPSVFVLLKQWQYMISERIGLSLFGVDNIDSASELQTLLELYDKEHSYHSSLACYQERKTLNLPQQIDFVRDYIMHLNQAMERCLQNKDYISDKELRLAVNLLSTKLLAADRLYGELQYFHTKETGAPHPLVSADDLTKFPFVKTTATSLPPQSLDSTQNATSNANATPNAEGSQSPSPLSQESQVYGQSHCQNSAQQTQAKAIKANNNVAMKDTKATSAAKAVLRKINLYFPFLEENISKESSLIKPIVLLPAQKAEPIDLEQLLAKAQIQHSLYPHTSHGAASSEGRQGQNQRKQEQSQGVQEAAEHKLHKDACRPNSQKSQGLGTWAQNPHNWDSWNSLSSQDRLSCLGFALHGAQQSCHEQGNRSQAYQDSYKLQEFLDSSLNGITSSLPEENEKLEENDGLPVISALSTLSKAGELGLKWLQEHKVKPQFLDLEKVKYLFVEPQLRQDLITAVACALTSEAYPCLTVSAWDFVKHSIAKNKFYREVYWRDCLANTQLKLYLSLYTSELKRIANTQKIPLSWLMLNEFKPVLDTLESQKFKPHEYALKFTKWYNEKCAEKDCKRQHFTALGLKWLQSDEDATQNKLFAKTQTYKFPVSSLFESLDLLPVTAAYIYSPDDATFNKLYSAYLPAPSSELNLGGNLNFNSLAIEDIDLPIGAMKSHSQHQLQHSIESFTVEPKHYLYPFDNVASFSYKMHEQQSLHDSVFKPFVCNVMQQRISSAMLSKQCRLMFDSWHIVRDPESTPEPSLSLEQAVDKVHFYNKYPILYVYNALFAEQSRPISQVSRAHQANCASSQTGTGAQNIKANVQDAKASDQNTKVCPQNSKASQSPLDNPLEPKTLETPLKTPLDNLLVTSSLDQSSLKYTDENLSTKSTSALNLKSVQALDCLANFLDINNFVKVVEEIEDDSSVSLGWDKDTDDSMDCCLDTGRNDSDSSKSGGTDTSVRVGGNADIFASSVEGTISAHNVSLPQESLINASAQTATEYLDTSYKLAATSPKLETSSCTPQQQVLADLLTQRQLEILHIGKSWQRDVIGKSSAKSLYEDKFKPFNMEHNVANRYLVSLPVIHTWEIWAVLTGGKWEHYVDPLTWIVLNQEWYQKYQATAVEVGPNRVVWQLPKALDLNNAEQVAKQMFCVCPKLISRGYVQQLAEYLTTTTTWILRWDG